MSKEDPLRKEYTDRYISPEDWRQLDLDIREVPRTPPSVGIFDVPLRCYVINQEWEAHLFGAISALAEWRAWVGDDDDRNTAVQEVLKFLSGEGDCMVQLQVRQNEENPCTLESSADGGTIWTPFANILDCITPEFIQESILDAISDNALVRDAIGEAGTGLPNVPGDTAKINYPAFTVPDCDNDVIYGYCKALWTYIDAKTVDFLQQIAETTNALSFVDQLLQLIPGYELLPFDDVQDWVENFGNYNFEAYQSEKTVELEQEIICALYCLAVDNGCTLNFGDVYNYFIGEIGGIDLPTFLATFGEWVIFMATGDYPGDRIVFLWSAFQLALAFTGQQFLGQKGIQRYAIQAQTGDPDNDWETLCEDCSDEWTWLSDFPSSANIWSPVNQGFGNLAQYVTSTGFVSVDGRAGASSWSRIILIATSEFTPTEINSVAVNYNLTKGTFETVVNAIAIIVTDSSNVEHLSALTSAVATNGSNQVHSHEFNIPDAKKVQVLVRCSARNEALFSGSVALNSITATGVGSNPFEA